MGVLESRERSERDEIPEGENPSGPKQPFSFFAKKEKRWRKRKKACYLRLWLDSTHSFPRLFLMPRVRGMHANGVHAAKKKALHNPIASKYVQQCFLSVIY